MNIFITGGTGTLGRQLAKNLEKLPRIEKIIIFSRDEGKQASMREEFPEGPPSKLRYRIGDIRDYDRLKDAMSGCTHVIHAAAMKRIDDCANHVQECVKTNVIGTQNVINACNYNGVSKALFISTDKACNPISAYGASKYMAEHAWIHGNSKLKTSFFIARYGNVIGSRGSVFYKWEELQKLGKEIPVCNRNMTRFFWTIEDAALFAMQILFSGNTGCIYIPKMQSYKMWEIAKSYGAPIEVGMRTNEKVHEYMISNDEIINTRECGGCYCIYPEYHQWSDNVDTVGTVITNPLCSETNALSDWHKND